MKDQDVSNMSVAIHKGEQVITVLSFETWVRHQTKQNISVTKHLGNI